jgi:hypothetical protein
MIDDCDRKAANYRALLDAGTDPAFGRASIVKRRTSTHKGASCVAVYQSEASSSVNVPRL